jgi:hypothetical protein
VAVSGFLGCRFLAKFVSGGPGNVFVKPACLPTRQACLTAKAGTVHTAFRLGLHAWRRKNIKINFKNIKRVRIFVLK